MKTTHSMLTSRICTENELRSPSFQHWCEALKERPDHIHRKIWEWGFICEALAESGLISEGKRGLGFAVGEEPLSALFASRGADVLATDLAREEAERIGWANTNQHASELATLNKRALCEPETFGRRVRFQPCDMNAIPAEFNNTFDFTWSACSLEHLGSIRHGQQFIYNSLNCLRDGGIAAHTTEYNISSNTDTVDNAGTVIFRRCDIEETIATLQNEGHEIAMNWDEGDGPADKFIDVPPYSHDPHLKLQLEGYTTTSIGLVIRKASRRRWWSLFLP
jgi:SAM-dependent methyltransferase